MLRPTLEYINICILIELRHPSCVIYQVPARPLHLLCSAGRLFETCP